MKRIILLFAIISTVVFASNASAMDWKCHVDTSSGLKSFTVDAPSGDEARSEARRRVQEWYPNTTIYSVKCG